LVDWHVFAAQAAAHTLMPSRPAVDYATPAFSRYHHPHGVDLTDYHSALTWLEYSRHDLAAVVAAAAEAGEHRAAYALAHAMQPLFIVHRHYQLAVEVNTTALDAAVALNDPHLETSMRKRLAHVLIRLDRTEDARQHIDTILRLATEHDDRGIEASGWECLGRLQSQLGQHQLAAVFFEKTVTIKRGLGQRRGEALALTSLGHAYRDGGKPAAALAPLEQARATLLGLDPPDPYNAARATLTLARALIELGQHPAASELLADCEEVLTALDSRHYLAQVYDTLADLHLTLDEETQARECHDRVHEIRASVEYQ
jgi:tetratricopeptide (TPR) repeat protein